ncbi:MAG: hypothetical protein JSU85_08145 [Candidatus Zixiibacteriota bacterium]|nr:MAG: hypothetical protein JSU85_08145 [candidate division Zixibacteria bacterium]
MARELIPCEDNNNLYKTSNNSWYEYLLTRLFCPIGQFGNNQLSVITFNYDRSLEQFLFNHLTNSFKASLEDCAAALDKIPILRVYGKLSDLKWKNENGRKYSESFNHEDLENAADQIKIVSESYDKTPEFQKAYELMANAEKVYFFGFGYHYANLERLAVNSLKKQNLIGTTYGLGKEECNQITDEWNITLDRPGLTIYEFLKDIDPLS